MAIIDNRHWRERHAIVLADGSFARDVNHNREGVTRGAENQGYTKSISIDSANESNSPHRASPLWADDVPANGTFLHVKMPGIDFYESIRRGERAGYDTVPISVLKALNGEGADGVGGLVPLAFATVRYNETKIRGQIAESLRQITAQRQTLGVSREAPIRLFILAGAFGGMWGGQDYIHDILIQESTRIGVPLSTQRVVVYPGVNASRDFVASKANAKAWTTEFAAKVTGRYLQLRQDPETGKLKRSAASRVPTFVISDINSAPERASSMSTAELAATVGLWLSLNTASDFGDILQADLQDFVDDAQEHDQYGDFRFARSFGLSFVTLNRDRVAGFSIQRLKQSAIGQLFSPVDAEEVDKSHRSFFRAGDLMEGDRFHHLSARLMAAGQDGGNLTSRFRGLYDHNLKGLGRISLLKRVPDLFETTVDQLGDFERSIRQAGQAVVEEATEQLDAIILKYLWDENKGVPFTEQWLTQVHSTLKHSIDLTTEKLQRRRDRVETLQTVARNIEDEAIPRFLEMGFAKQFANRKSIREIGYRYVQESKALQATRIDCAALDEALDVLQEVSEVVQERESRLALLASELNRTLMEAQAEELRIRNWEGTLLNPKGIRLDDELDELYSRILQRPSEDDSDMEVIEDRTAREILLQMREAGDLIEIASEPGRMAVLLNDLITERVRPAASGLHVQTELLRRYPADNRELASFLRERDREAFEGITISELATKDNGESVLRYLCADGQHAGRLRDVLNKSAFVRSGGNAQYRFVDTGNPEMVAFVHVRVNIPPGQISAYRKACRPAFRERSIGLEYEKMFTELVGRFLPEPGERAVAAEEKVALAKAYAVGALSMADSGGELLFKSFPGETFSIGSGLKPLDRFDLRVEITTSFYCDWREFGPQRLRVSMNRLKALLMKPDPSADKVASRVAEEIAPETVQAILEELAWYDRQTVPEATWWGRRPE